MIKVRRLVSLPSPGADEVLDDRKRHYLVLATAKMPCALLVRADLRGWIKRIRHGREGVMRKPALQGKWRRNGQQTLDIIALRRQQAGDHTTTGITDQAETNDTKTRLEGIKLLLIGIDDFSREAAARPELRRAIGKRGKLRILAGTPQISHGRGRVPRSQRQGKRLLRCRIGRRMIGRQPWRAIPFDVDIPDTAFALAQGQQGKATVLCGDCLKASCICPFKYGFPRTAEAIRRQGASGEQCQKKKSRT